MKWGLPHLRLAGLALPLLTAGCMSGVMPGADASDPSCVLLCALTREIAGGPAPQQVAATTPKTTLASKHAARRRVAHPTLPRVAKVVAVPAAKPRTIVAHAHLRPFRHPSRPEVSIVPQTPTRAAAPAAVAPAPLAIAPQPPAEAPRSLGQAIPGSAGIMVPSWQAQ